METNFPLPPARLFSLVDLPPSILSRFRNPKEREKVEQVLNLAKSFDLVIDAYEMMAMTAERLQHAWDATWQANNDAMTAAIPLLGQEISRCNSARCHLLGLLSSHITRLQLGAPLLCPPHLRPLSAPSSPRRFSSPHCHPPIVTRPLSPAHCHPPIVTRPLSPAHCHPPIVTHPPFFIPLLSHTSPPPLARLISPPPFSPRLLSTPLLRLPSLSLPTVVHFSQHGAASLLQQADANESLSMELETEGINRLAEEKRKLSTLQRGIAQRVSISSLLASGHASSTSANSAPMSAMCASLFEEGSSNSVDGKGGDEHKDG